MEHLPAVDWAFAASTGRALVPPGPALSATAIADVVAELRDAAARASGHVAEVTLLERPASADVLVVDRANWVDAVCQSAASMLDAVGTEPADSPFAEVRAKALAVQAGAVFAVIANRILGQFDPFVAAPRLLLVAPNVVAVERQLGVRPDDFRLWVCLHEVTHRVQFSSAPWLGDYMKSNVDTLGAVGDESVNEVLTRLMEELRRRRDNGVSDDPADRGILGLLRATQPPPQREALDRLLMLGTLLEGHADHVMDAVGPAVIPTVAQIREAFDQRRRRPANPVQRLLRALLGVDAKVAQYVRGKAFVDEVVGKVGMQRFNTVWTDADTLPRPDEISTPQRWIDRVLG